MRRIIQDWRGIGEVYFSVSVWSPHRRRRCLIQIYMSFQASGSVLSSVHTVSPTAATTMAMSQRATVMALPLEFIDHILRRCALSCRERRRSPHQGQQGLERWNPLHIASQNGHLDVVQLRLEPAPPLISGTRPKRPLWIWFNNKSTSFPVHKPAFISCVESLYVFSPLSRSVM